MAKSTHEFTVVNRYVRVICVPLKSIVLSRPLLLVFHFCTFVFRTELVVLPTEERVFRRQTKIIFFFSKK